MLLVQKDPLNSFWDAPVGRPLGPIAGVGVFCPLLLLWLIPLLYCLWSTYWVARRWEVISAPPEPLLEFFDASRLRIWCQHCNIFVPDRTKHCPKFNKCLPFYDHECAWWTGIIWIHNLKAYMLFLTMLPIYHMYLLRLSIWLQSSKEQYRKAHWWMPFGVTTAAIGLLLTSMIACHFWMVLIRCNVLGEELETGIWFLDDNGSASFWKHESGGKSPYDNGFRQNASDVFGPWYTWPIFWTKIPLMDKLEGYRQEKQEELTTPLEFLRSSRSSRVQVSSTGYDSSLDLESGKLNRRSGRHSYP